jgi:hypothetical protein
MVMPLKLMIFGRLEDKPEDYRKFSVRVAEMQFDDLEGLYRQFRRLKPRKRWSICFFDAENHATFLDTQLFEKATGRKIPN